MNPPSIVGDDKPSKALSGTSVFVGIMPIKTSIPH
jgi:hypothetical protein